ncbi:MAG: peptide deformylase [Clostridia bacterium]|nr:peptide deformylase [Clostridia bacterium]
MAIRNIVKEGDETLGKVCRPVTEFNERLWQLLDDMKETLVKADGVGLAAPQIGVLRRIFVMNVGDGWVEAINPEIVEREGEQEDVEGCLSCPNQFGITRRPQKVRMKAQNRQGKWFYLTGEGLKARCICHETDHLDGVLFKQHVIRMLDPSELA